MMMSRYSQPELFEKITTTDREYIIKGFPEHYRSKAKDPSKYNSEHLETEVITHFLLYAQTRRFDDRELAVLLAVYCASALRGETLSIKYPEFFI